VSDVDKRNVDDTIRRKIRRKYTIQDIVQMMPQFMTPSAKIVTSLSIRTMHYVVIKALSQKTGKSMSDIVNEILDYALNNCEESCTLIDKYIDMIDRNKENEE